AAGGLGAPSGVGARRLGRRAPHRRRDPGQPGRARAGRRHRARRPLLRRRVAHHGRVDAGREDQGSARLRRRDQPVGRARAPVQRLADRLAGFLVYFALAAAGLTFLVTGDVRATIAVVIVAGACGIAAGTPLAILGGIGQSARLGAIVKGGVHLETLGRVDTVVLDKTGTLTYGRPAVQRVLAVDGVSPEAVLDAAAAAEQRSEHPLGQTIVAHARAQKRPVVEPDRFSYTPGRGIAAEVADATVLVGNRAWMRERGVVMSDASGTGIGRETAASAASE